VGQDGAERPVTDRHQPPARRVEVDPARLVRWVDGFAERHGTPLWSSRDGALVLAAPDGAEALVRPVRPQGMVPSAPETLERWAGPPQRMGLVLVRRGGYAVGAALGEHLTSSKVGTRYVQSRTAAGGWSQQRYARRRGNQADELVAAVAAHAVLVVLPSAPEHLVLGGDRALVRSVLAHPQLAALAGLPARELYDLPDPRRSVLQQALRRGRAVRITVVQP
jgi:hypothetical protein